MIIGLYNPYFDGLGGGERYTLALASHWAKTHDVRIFWDEPGILKSASERFNIDTSRISVVPNIFLTKGMGHRWSNTRQYDVIFVLSDGSIPVHFARKGILHFQLPFSHIPGLFPKILLYSAIVCNSNFTKRHISLFASILSRVIYPPVAPVTLTSNKEKLIVSVGRFHPLKRHDVLINTFLTLQSQGLLPGWKLRVLGGLLPGDAGYFQTLKDLVKVRSIELISNATHEQITQSYAVSSIYWHSAGYNSTSPTECEHFGISTVEAMSAGAVPIVFKGGGLTEIVQHTVNGYTWTTVEELMAHTAKCATLSVRELSILQGKAMLRSKNFSEELFFAQFDALL